MSIHFIFNVLYLIALSWCADGYHKRLKNISNLEMVRDHPKANKEIIYKGLDEARIILKKFKILCFKILFVIFLMHLILTFIIETEFGRYHSWELLYPLGGIIVSYLILLVIFWLRGKGGGVPNNKFMENTSGTFFK